MRGTRRWWCTTSRLASVVSGWSVTIFALHAENGPKWAIFAVLGEFCTGLGMPGCVLGEFCTGLGVSGCVHGEFCPEGPH